MLPSPVHSCTPLLGRKRGKPSGSDGCPLGCKGSSTASLGTQVHNRWRRLVDLLMLTRLPRQRCQDHQTGKRVLTEQLPRGVGVLHLLSCRAMDVLAPLVDGMPVPLGITPGACGFWALYWHVQRWMSMLTLCKVVVWTILYRGETWPIGPADVRKLRNTQMSCFW
jgi:hypothetical protein